MNKIGYEFTQNNPSRQILERDLDVCRLRVPSTSSAGDRRSCRDSSLYSSTKQFALLIYPGTIERAVMQRLSSQDLHQGGVAVRIDVLGVEKDDKFGGQIGVGYDLSSLSNRVGGSATK